MPSHLGAPLRLRTALLSTAFLLMHLHPTLASAEDPQQPAPDSISESTKATPTFLDSITVSATRGSSSVGEAPATVSVVPRSEIEASVASDARDLLTFLPGVEIAGDPTRLGLNGFLIRGLGGNRVLTQVDGVPTPEQFDFGPFNVHRPFLDLDAVESLEVLRNAGSSLYGSDALAGVVSVVTRDPADLLQGERAHLGARLGWDGRADAASVGVSAAATLGSWQGGLVASGSRGHELDNQGERATLGATRTAPNPQDNDAAQVLGKLVRLDDRSSLRFAVEGNASDADTSVLSSLGLVNQGIGLPPGAVFTLETQSFETVDEVERLRLSADQLLSLGAGWADTLRWRAFGQSSETTQTTTELRQTRFGGGPLGPLRVTDAQRVGSLSFEQSTLGVELQADKALGAKARLVWGISAQQDRFDTLRDRVEVNLATGQRIASSLIFPTKYFPESEVLELGAYVQAEWSLLGERLKLVPGLRYDRYDLDARADDRIYVDGNPGTEPPADSRTDSLSPKLGLVWAFSPKQTAYLQYARGFRAPPYSAINNGFTNAAGGYITLPNADLEAETSDNYELGWRWSGERSAVAVTLFENRFDQFIETVTLGVDPATGLLQFQPLNFQQVETRGLELSAELRWPGGWRLRTAGTWVEGEDTGLDVPLNSVSPPRGVLGLGWRPAGGRFGGELVLTAVGEKKEEDLDASVSPRFAAPSYQLLDLTATARLPGNLDLRLALLNLTDETYWQWADIRGGLAASSAVLDRFTSPGRSISVALARRW
jgi:hemoglobin/transferrin/lactoferrin receptor protein